jgi:hypothetical protein
MFHPCSEYQATGKTNDDLSDIAPSQLLLLGEGDHGIVLLYTKDGNPYQQFAVKITYSDPYIREMQTNCRLEQLKPDTQAFITSLGWRRHHGILDSWLERLPEYNQNEERIDWAKYADKDLVYIFMEYSTFRIRLKKGITPSGNTGLVYWEHLNAVNAKKIMFILLHGLYVARKKMQFSHNDLHDGQIMLFARPNPRNPIVLSGGKFVIESCPFVPKFIDFGESVMLNDSGSPSSDDVAQLCATFLNVEAAEPFVRDLMETEEYEIAAGSARTNSSAIWKLLRHKLFAEFYANTQTGAPITCMGCMAIATHVIEGTRHHVCAHCPKKVSFFLNTE